MRVAAPMGARISSIIRLARKSKGRVLRMMNPAMKNPDRNLRQSSLRNRLTNRRRSLLTNRHPNPPMNHRHRRHLRNKNMRVRSGFFLFLCVICAIFIHTARAQEVFSGGDQGSDNEEFNSNDGGPGPGGGPSGGFYGGHRQITNYTGCGPWYNSYNNYVQTMLKHWGGGCEMRNGNQIFCHQRKAGMCNPDAGELPEWPLVDSGSRFTPNCQQICDFNVGKGGGPGGDGEKTVNRRPYQPQRQKPVTNEPDDRALTDGISDCFKNVGYDYKTGEPLDYYTRPHVVRKASAPGEPIANYDPANYGVITYDPAQLDALPLTSRVFVMARVYAEHAQAMRFHKYEPNGDAARDITHDEDRIIGFVSVCLERHGIVHMLRSTGKEYFKNDWRTLYGQSLNDADPKNDPHVELFREGGACGGPLLLSAFLPPGAQNTAP